MRFWDTSALVPALLGEPRSSAVRDLLDEDPAITVWWATEVECVSALARLEREGDLDGPSMVSAVERLGAVGGAWREVQPIARVRQTATRLLRVHPLRAADALQLAAAIAAAEDDPRSLPLITLDDRLAIAAEREGFPVVQPASV